MKPPDKAQYYLEVLRLRHEVAMLRKRNSRLEKVAGSLDDLIQYFDQNPSLPKPMRIATARRNLRSA